jgi:hypothetical protein
MVNKMVKCEQKFGLCPMAKCVPNPNESGSAFCFCDVVTEKNYSIGHSHCKNIMPYTDNLGRKIVFSDFSPVIYKMGYKAVLCPPKAVSLDCMNKKCSVYPNDPTKAICVCDKIDNQGKEWITYNKIGTEKQCDYQSGASYDDWIKIKTFIKGNP